MATALRYLPVFASALVLACPQALCCCLWALPDAPAPVATCCAKLAGKGAPDRAPLGHGMPCKPGLRCCGQSVSALPEKPVTQADPSVTTLSFVLAGDQTRASAIVAATSQAETVVPAGVDPPLHVQLCVWRC